LTTSDLQIGQSYAYAVARIRQAENGLLDRNRIARILDASEMSEILRILGETEYSWAVSDVAATDYEAILTRELERVFRYVSQFVPDLTVVDLFRMKYDLHNCKVAFRALALGVDGSGLWSPLGTVSAAEIWRAATLEIGLDGFPKHARDLLGAGLDHLQLGVSGDTPADDSRLEQLADRPIDPQALDAVLDRAYFSSLDEAVYQIGSSLLTKLLRLRVDLVNMTAFLRCVRLRRGLAALRSAFIPFGDLPLELFEKLYNEPVETFVREMSMSMYDSLISEWSAFSKRKDAVAILERLGRRYFTEMCSASSAAVFFGPEPIASYLIAKENEINDLRTILVGKANGLDTESIRERLSGAYA
jgi:V/A-type H+-transporting ATPase subunit C